jgi:hypothetical protein
MTCKMAVWLDHKTAVIITACDRNLTTTTVTCDYEPAPRGVGGLRAATGAGVHGVDPDARRDARHAHYLHRYYEHIIGYLERADTIHLMGPGQAKIELKHHLAGHKPLAGKPVSLATVDRMTDAQIVAHARKVFGVPLRRVARA